MMLIASFLLAGSVTMLAQSHDRTHPRTRHHDQSTHDAIDPALHDALHALIGTWTGTIAADGGPAKMHLTAKDVDGRLTLQLTSDSSLRVGAASHVALSRDSVRWTQALGEKSCTATASLKDVGAKPSAKLKGTLACETGTMAFAFDRAKE